MAEWNEHVLSVRARLDKASKQEMIDSVRDVFTEGAHIDFKSKENLRGLHELADIMRKVFSAAGNSKFDFSKMIELPGPELFDGLKEAAKEFDSVWSSVIQKFDAHSLKDFFMQDLSALDSALQRIGKSAASVKGLEKAFKDVRVSDPEKILERLKATQSRYTAADNINWEDQYADLLQYIKLYEKYVTNANADTSKGMIEQISQIGPYTYKQLKEVEAQISTSLQNIFNLKGNKQLIGLTDNGRIDFEAVPKVVKTLDVGDIVGQRGQKTVEIPVEFKVKLDAYREAFISKNYEQQEQIEEELAKMFPGDVWDDVVYDRLLKFADPKSLKNVTSRSYSAIYKDFVGYGMPVGDGVGSSSSGDDRTPEDVENARKVAEYEEQARIASEAKAKAEMESTESVRQATNIDNQENDDYEIIQKENGALEDKLELLRDIAEQYGINITQKQRDRHEELNQKDMDTGLTTREDERYWELSEQIEEADSALEEFGQTYDKIILKLANGKKVEILPDDKGLRSLYKFSDEYGETYGGVDIEDVQFVRKEIQQVEQAAQKAEHAVEELNKDLKATEDKDENIGGQPRGNTGVQPTALSTEETANLETVRAKVAEVTNAVNLKNKAFNDEEHIVRQAIGKENAALMSLKGNIEKITTAVQEKTKEFLNEQTVVKKVAESEAYALESVRKVAAQTRTELSNVSTLLNNIKTGQNLGVGLNNIDVNVNYPENNNGQIESIVSSIRSATESIDKKIVKGTKTVIGGDSVGTPKSKKGVTSDGFDDDLDTQKLRLDKLRAELKASGKTAAEVTTLTRGLAISLGKIKDDAGLKKWKTKFTQKNLEVGIAKIGDKPKLIHQAQVEAETVRELVGLYKELGELKTKANTITNIKEKNRLEGDINAKRSGLSSIDYKTEAKFRIAEDNAFNQLHTSQIKDLAKDYEQLGKLRAQFDASKDAKIKESLLILSEELKKKRESLALTAEEIYALKQKTNASYKEAARLASADKQQKDVNQARKDEAARLQNIAKLEKEIGELEADRDRQSNDGVKSAIKEEIDLRKELIELQHKGLDMPEQDEAYRRKEAKFKTDAAKAAAAQADRDNKKSKKDADKEERKRLADEKKLAKKRAMTGKAGSAIGRAESVWLDAEEIENIAPDKVKNQIKELSDELDILRTKQHEVNIAEEISDEQSNELIAQTRHVNKLTEALGPLVSEYQKLSGANVDESKSRTSTLNDKSGLSDYKNELQQYVQAITNGKGQIKDFDAKTRTLTYTVKTGKNEFTEYTAAVRHLDNQLVSVQGATKRTETFLEATQRKMEEISSYMSGMSAISKLTQSIRQGIQYVREIDLALTELRKVTDETEEGYDRFLETAAKTGAKLGSTISAVTEATATFAKLGYSIEQATEMAEAAIVYKNVGDNIASTEDAADSIISTLKGFGREASESMLIVDKFNEVGNRFAITSQGIGEALRLSASALNEGGNSLDESIGLITAANEVVNDPSSVGTALKTLTLRLRGSKTELEEMGEDVSDMATTTSQLQAKLLALTGGQVDIMLNETTFKNSTQIIREMADAWSDMNDIQRASALELMGGKRQANVLSALIQNFDTVEKVIETSANSAGSALQENEKYLDSIQGKIDQFNNAMQTMWSNALDSDFIKDIVSLGTEIIKIIDKIGLLNSALIALATYSMIKNKMGPIAFLSSISDMIREIPKKISNLVKSFKYIPTATSKAAKAFEDLTISVSSFQETMTKSGLDVDAQKSVLSQLGLDDVNSDFKINKETFNADKLVELANNGTINKSQVDQLASVYGLKDAYKELTVEQMANAMSTLDLTDQQKAAIVNTLDLGSGSKLLTQNQIEQAFAANGLATADGALAAANVGLKTTNDALTISFSNLWKAIWPILLVMAALHAITWIIDFFGEMIPTTENLTEELNDMKSSLSDVRSELDSVNQELETTQERMAELLAKDTLTFVEQEELDKLKETNDELERRKDMLEAQEEYEAERVGRQASKVINSAKQERNWWETGLITGLFSSSADEDVYGDIDDYSEVQKEIAEIEKKLANKNLSSDEREDLNEELRDLEEDLASEKEDVVEYIDILTKALDGVEYGDSEESDAALDYYHQLLGRWNVAQGTPNAKSNEIKRIFNKDEFSDVSDKIDEYVKALEKGDKSAKDSIDSLIKNNADLVAELNAMDIDPQDAVDYFTKLGQEANFSTLDGKITEVSNAATIFEGLLNEQTFNVDGVDIGLADLFDEEGKVIQTKLSQVFQDTSDQTREDITNLLEGSYDQIKNGTVDTERLLSGFGLKTAQQVLEIQNKILGEQNLELFPNLEEEIDGIIDKFDEFSAAIGSVVDAMDTLEQARAEEAYSGSISIETLENLMKYTDDYSQLVKIDETGAITLAKDAEKLLIEQRIQKIKTDAAAAVQTAQTNLEQAKYNAKAVNETGPVQEALTSATDALAGSWAYLGSIIGDVSDGNFKGMFDRASTAYGKVTAGRKDNRTQVNVSVEDAQEALNKALDQQKIADALTSGNIKSKYSSDEASGGNKTTKDVADDAFQKLMDYWENRIAANQARYDQLQNEIDLLETKGQKADASYYQEQAKLEEQRLKLLNGQKAAAQSYLATLTEGSEEWWEVANILNDLESDIDDVTASLVDLQDAIGEIETYKFEEFNTRLDNLISKLDTIRNLIAPDGEEDWFDDEGNWTESGVAVLGSHVQELELYKQNYQKTMDELAKYEPDYKGNETYYAGLGIHSEQEYYDKVSELTDNQYQFAESINDTEQSIVDMYESSIDAVEEYINTLIDGYNDYIDSVKEALDAERDLYEFKKNVQKQSKDIAEIERRIASLSGSTNKSEVAERRKLEAQLYEARESLNDTYYDHAKDAQSDALDAEQSAYEETMNKFIEGMHESLKIVTQDMDKFLADVTMMVSLNAGAILQKYEETELPLDDALTSPWEAAKEAVGDYDGDALELMNTWVQNGFLTEFPNTVKDSLESPWKAGQTAVGAFTTSVDTQMKKVVSTIETNVKTASGKLSSLYKQIEDTEKRAADAQSKINSYNSGNYDYGAGVDVIVTGAKIAPTNTLRPLMQTSKEMILGSKSFVDKNTETINGVKYYRDSNTGYYYKISDLNSKRKYDGGRTTGWAIPKGTWFYTKHAKGTTGTTRDEWAITDEPQFGDELVLVPGKDGNLSFMRKGTGVVPADLTANLMEWGQFTPDSMNFGNGVNVNMINNAVNKPEFNFSFDALVKAENITEETLPAVKKLVTQELNRFTKELNYALKGKGAR